MRGQSRLDLPRAAMPRREASRVEGCGQIQALFVFSWSTDETYLKISIGLSVSFLFLLKTCQIDPVPLFPWWRELIAM